jgi:hypothetical protein
MEKGLIWLIGGMFFMLLCLGAAKTVFAQPELDDTEGFGDDDLLLDELLLDDEFLLEDEKNIDEPETKPEINMGEIEEFYGKFDPQRMEMLRKLKKENKDRFEEALRKSWEEMLMLKRLKQEAPKEFERLMNELKKNKQGESKPEDNKNRPQKPEINKPSQKRPDDDFPQPPDDQMIPMEKVNLDEVMAFLKEFHPELAEEVAKLKKDNPEMYEQILRQHAREMMELRELKKRDPKRYEQLIQQQKKERRIRELADKYRQSKDEKEKETIKAEMAALLGESFDIMEQGREEEIKRMEEEVNKLKEKMKRRKAEKEKIVGERLKEILGEKEEWNWR